MMHATPRDFLDSEQSLPLDRVSVIILGGGEGKRLEPLTKERCKPAVSFGGRYTLIDIPISHALGSGLEQIFVIGQYLADSLKTHVQEAYSNRGVIQFLTPQGSPFKGTADAIRQNLSIFQNLSTDYFLILSGDHLYNIHFQEMIRFGIESNAGMVIAAQPIDEKNARRMGVLKLDGTEVVDFVEKPQEKHLLDQFCSQQGSAKPYLASMGIYLFKKETLVSLLQEDPREDFGKHLIQTQMKKQNVHAYLYDGYWEDIGTIESYYAANLALTDKTIDAKSGFHCYDDRFVILTKTHHLPGASIEGTLVSKSILSEGSIIEAKEICRSIIGRRSVIKKGTVIRDSILMGNAYYEGENRRPTIGENCFLSRVIIDENVTIGDGVQLLNREGHQCYDSPHLYVRDGIIIIPKGAHLPNGFEF